jgi:23S rRNA pseudouridine1911/1915/1917 synthase
MEFDILYEDGNVLVIDKPAGIVVFPEGKTTEKTLIDYLLENFPYLRNAGEPPRYGIAHRLDKDTSGILLVAKNSKTLKFLQKQFKEGEVEKKYLALVTGNIKTEGGRIETLIGRSPKDRKKQKVYLANEPGSEGKRKAITEYKVLEKFKNYTLIEALPKTGRKHQIRVHLAHLSHPIVGDKMYGFKNQPLPEGLKRQFLHASYLRIELPDGGRKEFKSGLPNDLKTCLPN